MSQINHMDRHDSDTNYTTCKCGAKYEIYTDDGTPGCRDIEKAYCKFCGTELAEHYGTCDAKLIDDSNVSEELKANKNK